MTDRTKFSTVFPALQLSFKLPRFGFGIAEPEARYGKSDVSRSGNLEQLGGWAGLMRFQAL